jgi:hypothetical protein
LKEVKKWLEGNFSMLYAGDINGAGDDRVIFGVIGFYFGNKEAERAEEQTRQAYVYAP